MRKNLLLLKTLIKEIMESNHSKTFDCADFSSKFDVWKGYYGINPNSPPPIHEVIEAWVQCGFKVTEEGTFHAMYSAEELWEYREYTWSVASAGGEEVRGAGDQVYQDKWHFVPDEQDNVGTKKWEKMFADMKHRGWDNRNPAYFEIGKNGIAKVGEGNHRLAIAKELNLSVPVFFTFKHSVNFSHTSNVAR
jgi:hypothetical protein